MEKLVLVNKKDEVIGSETKEKCHLGQGILHRAFSVYIFNKKGQLLVHKRSKNKKLWPLYWSNSCCSHPQKNESYVEAGKKRLKEELGFTCPVKFVDKFQYQARYKNIGSENETCAILVGEYDGKVRPDPKEVAGWQWVNIDRLKDDFKKNPGKYTPWLKIGLRRYLKIKEKELKKKEELDAFLAKTSKIVEPIIRELLKNNVDKKFHQLVDYQISTGGKRLRPALAIISCKLLGGALKDILYPAAGLEILHNCTLIVDDIIDHSSLRRGKPTTWFNFGKSIAECVGLDYLAAAFEASIHSAFPVVICETFTKTLKDIMMNGEILDILFEQKGRGEEFYIIENRYHKITIKDYYKMISKKTASLFQTCCEVGGICAGATKNQLEVLKDYGFNLGIAFQIQDDILDIFGDEKKFGKKIGKDIEERKLGNIVILSALKELSQPEKREFLKIIRQKEIKSKDIKKAIKLIQKTNSYSKSHFLAESFVKKANENLKILPKNKWNKILENFADFVIQREK